MLKYVTEFSAQTETGDLTWQQAERVLEGLAEQVLKGLPREGRILLVPPDITRCYSGGGMIAAWLYRRLGREAQVRIMPAVGTHRAMSRGEQIRFFGEARPSRHLYRRVQAGL